MLQLKNIIKDYYVGTQTVEALKGVSLSFRRSEFVAILGPSGCGKTTLLNIIGGLDRYTTGDIVINGISTKLYADGDWDAYRNHSIGFIFQSYNLIPHQTILENVELALTISGIPKKERRERAKNALEKVGLKDHFNKLPSQLSGGQMQRVAIARAIVNNPDIILADEPTGALDTETSIQVMDILQEIAKEKLVIMVTHNPDLATAYATRIIKLRDGNVKEDSNPFEYTEKDKSIEQEMALKKEHRKAKKPSMSFLTALSLSFKNLGTKRARTILTSFAGSIGIIGIALILSLSSGFNGYIATVQRDTLSNYPVSIAKGEMSLTGYATSFMGSTEKPNIPKYPDDKGITSNKMFGNILDSVFKSYSSNDLKAFKSYLDGHSELLNTDKIAAINYSYDFGLHLYTDDNGTTREVNKIGPIEQYIDDETARAGFSTYYKWFKQTMESGLNWGEMVNNLDLIKSQYDLLEGEWPNFNENESSDHYSLTIVVDEYNRIPDYSLYMMGFMTDEEVKYMFAEMVYKIFPTEANKKILDSFDKNGEKFSIKDNYTFDELLNREYSVLLNGDYYYKNDEKTVDFGDGNVFNVYSEYDETDKDYNSIINEKLKSAIKLKVTGIIRQKKTVSSSALERYMYYTPELTKALIKKTNSLPVVVDQVSYTDNEYLTSLNDDGNKYTWDILKGSAIKSDLKSELFTTLGIVDENNPSAITFYPTSFENKDYVIKLIDNYNAANSGDESKQIRYTDYIGSMISSITVIINAISYVLIAFVSISLVVSSIMIGVITYISVLERTKEIGILRSLGASKRDVARVFNAETMIIGLISGVMGIALTLILDIPISFIVKSLTGIPNVAALPVLGGIILIAISVALTLIAGLIPSGFASKRDPVIALRSE